MNLSPSKQAANNERKMQEVLREKTLADPEAHGLHGSLSDGVNRERMLQLAREYEEKEAQRIKDQGPRVEDKGGEMPAKEARPIPEQINSRWVWTARRSELETVLKVRFGVETDLSVIGLDDLRKMTQNKRKGGDGSGLPRQRSKRAPRNAVPLIPRSSDPIPVTPAPEKPREAKYKVHCMACGFCMEISAAALGSLADGGEA